VETSAETRAASVSLFAAKYLRYVFYVVELGPFASASHQAISYIRVILISKTRLLNSSSISSNVDAIKPKDLLDGRPGFFVSRVVAWGLPTTTIEVGVDVDADGAGMSVLADGGGAGGCVETVLVTGGGAGGSVEMVLVALRCQCRGCGVIPVPTL
jgi:hypothetical protein